MQTKFDVVYYWVGGTERGTWRECWPANIQEALDRLARMGYYAVPGRASIGAPEGNPLKAAEVQR